MSSVRHRSRVFRQVCLPMTGVIGDSSGSARLCSVFGTTRALKTPCYTCAIRYSESHATPCVSSRFPAYAEFPRFPAITSVKRVACPVILLVAIYLTRRIENRDFGSLAWLYRYTRDILYIHTRFTLTHGPITCQAFTEYSYMRADIVCTWRRMSQIQLGKFNFGASFDFNLYTCYSHIHCIYSLFLYIYIYIRCIKQ